MADHDCILSHHVHCSRAIISSLQTATVAESTTGVKMSINSRFENDLHVRITAMGDYFEVIIIIQLPQTPALLEAKEIT